MKKLILFIVAVFSGFCLAVESPIGNPTVPPSSRRSGLIRSPNPIDLSGNRIITGQVSGGKEFRGFVPYRSDTEFGAPLGSDAITPFLRQSAPINLGSRQPYLPQPYYVPSRTVTTLRRDGSSGLITYPSIRLSGGTGDFTVPAYFKAPITSRDLSQITLPYEYTLARPLSYTNPTDLAKLVSQGLVSQQEQRDLILNLERARAEAKESKTEAKPKFQSEDTNISTIQQPTEPTARFEPLEPQRRGQIAQEIPIESKSVYEQMLEEAFAAAPEQQPPTVKEANEPTEEREGIAEIETETTEAIKGVHKTFATRATNRFNYYMKSAEEYLKEGQYYRAADAYTLASIYKPEDPLAYAGRAHALFASGEYMSSAYYLMRAINIFPQYVNVKIDLNAMIPDKDRLESRIADVTKWIDKTKSPELQFLLAYIYFQLDKTEQALNAINFSAKELPENEAVQALRQAIGK